MKKIAIIIVNWNGWKDTIECLESISQLSIVNCQLSIVVVDNASIDNSVEKINEFLEKHSHKLVRRPDKLIKKKEDRGRQIRLNSRMPTLRLIKNRVNLGFAEGNNVGIKKALDWGVDYVMLLNNDTLVDKNLVDSLFKVMEEDKKISILGPKIYFAPGCEFHRDRYKKEEQGKVIWYGGGKIDWNNVYCSHRGVDEVDTGQYSKQEKTDFISGCCMMIRKEVFDKIGFLDKKYFLYLEDVDFCLRARQTGFKIIYAPKAHLWHKNAASSEKPGSKVHLYYQTRNRLYFGLKYAPISSKLALFRESVKFIINNGIKRKACFDFYSGKLGYEKFN